MKKYRIESDGTVLGVRILDANGQDISQHVRAYTVTQRVGEQPIVTLEMAQVQIEVTCFGDEHRVFVAGGQGS